MSKSEKKKNRLVSGRLFVGIIAAIIFAGYFFSTIDFAADQNDENEEFFTVNENGVRILSEDIWKKVTDSPQYAKGSESADIVLVEFTDYQCPFCARHTKEVNPQLQREFIDKGILRYIKLDLPLSFHSNAFTAAQAARCAGDQDKYWEMHRSLFENQKVWAKAENEAEFNKIAQLIGLNVPEFQKCLTEGKYADEVENDIALARKINIGGTPVFFINGKELRGAEPYEVFEAEITKALLE